MSHLHFTRALWAAGITLSMAPAVILIIEIVERLVRGRTVVSASMLERFVDEVPRMTGIFGVLLLMAAVPMVVLWRLSATRGWFGRSWVAGVAGAVCGVLLVWPWMVSFAIFFPYRPAMTWDDFREAAPILAPLAALAAGLCAFLHAFFVNRAIGKMKWLEEQGRDVPGQG
ncbi:hypothetical protein OVA24_16910 [Luteolibacter sp. SL250]|uniref:hypothetical protein n=1 Tax=Luteolibacter sp. SL250 TaxID=2995170 RepID=UPI00226EAED9|nr:hypothetical protein [Luteolibacter sp. SL250]WAC18914.1 hypothetical protein OVA24_16910 [Luteolibacter sp. SL250]